MRTSEPESLRERLALDPRTTMLLVAGVSAAALGPYGQHFIVPGVALAVLLALSVNEWRRAVGVSVIALGAWLAARLLLPISSPAVAASVVVPLDYVARYSAAVGVAIHLFATTSPTVLHAALRALRLPRSIAVTLVVMIRFLPVVLTEACAVLDAMRLQGLTRPSALFRHPILVIERFTVPMIASSLRAGDDLSSAALLRGLGSPTPPSVLHPPRFRAIDAVWVLIAVVLFIAGWYWT
ncbi:energy-coupling factor transporter transmembrane component T family protein [Dermatophilus congolensis]|uniref:energy-coupling factor transporter transmembrane component T family protein n=1 Tax=Dermatophilus congolensis TaxID=1863 RepID=UPI001AAFCCD1|nr:energy-coupling factor transporter transmembrane component T [Dermatophilus congolensis]MBO3142735.1 energy-coupling factor transporter transmembrane protein EcfT [Dermatophilus congolensis]MBO3151727.1 energy-coupling factor transporter transmembrane protein EcfT [Dermatophilus congolensis]MBO3161272.1 energy-coupling factor transporter transmembrane protein EcfT [Dermatophilus congolensis]MBO3163009.1 energy-coupling factor transporter transmembrane protein EcfT [Dermatophilus congolensis]